MRFKSFDEGLRAVCEEWNAAERVIKQAQHINGAIVRPAIYELRYAGRRLVEAHQARKSNPGMACSLLSDAHFDCCRARHDAIDAGINKVAATLEISVRVIGPDTVFKYFPDYIKLGSEVVKIQELVAVSRDHRESRETIYATVENSNFARVVELYQKYKNSEKLLRSAAKQQRRRQFFSYAVGVVGALGVIYTVISSLF